MKLKVIIAITVCKTAHTFARLLGRGGTAMPGRIALKVYPKLLGTLSENVQTVVITGTNGKTTTSRMIEQAFSDAKLGYIANRSGANLLSGITTEFALNSTIFGKCKKQYAIIECDEAAAKTALGLLQPKVVLVTNLFRDQLDRYGEVTHTLSNIREGLKNTPDALLCLNADCSLTSSLSLDLPNKVVYYGIDKSASSENVETPRLSDATHCIRCKNEYEYDYVTYSHLGGYRCPQCGYTRHDTDVGVTAIKDLGMDTSTVEMNVYGEASTLVVNLPAVYNIYNAAGAIAATTQMGLSAKQAFSAIGSFNCGFGRMEKFEIGSSGARMMLIKNPAGCNQVIEFLSTLTQEFELVVLLNDNDNDGKDVSWIWDAEFEKLADMSDLLKGVTVSGIRAWDMYTRIKYAGIPAEKLSVEQDYAELTNRIAAMDKPVFIIPTYSALLDFRPHLIRHCGGKEFWEG